MIAAISIPNCRCSGIVSKLVSAGHPPPPFRSVAITGPEVIAIGQTPPHWRAVLGPVTSSALLEFAHASPVRIQADKPRRHPRLQPQTTRSITCCELFDIRGIAQASHVVTSERPG